MGGPPVVFARITGEPPVPRSASHPSPLPEYRTGQCAVDSTIDSTDSTSLPLSITQVPTILPKIAASL